MRLLRRYVINFQVQTIWNIIFLVSSIGSREIGQGLAAGRKRRTEVGVLCQESGGIINPPVDAIVEDASSSPHGHSVDSNEKYETVGVDDGLYM